MHYIKIPKKSMIQIGKLSRQNLKLIFYICTLVNEGNEIVLDESFDRSANRYLGIAESSVVKHLRQLMDEHYLLKLEDKTYILNPSLFEQV